MSHIALYREWRPQTFSDVVAQKQVIYPLRQSVINGEINHAYLFSGTRGTGKTSTAKIFAKAVNCLHPLNGDPCNKCEICQGINDGSLLDVMEIDAASNNSVDNIRRLTEEVVFMPTRAKYKVYIIDEVHMLSPGAFNALLKTLEEPPAHAIFILATTDPQRIPATVISRCLRFDFRRIPQEEIVNNLQKIAAANHLEIETAALSVIAQLSDGAMRDAISLLDQAKSGIEPPITKENLFAMVGIVQDQFLLSLFEALLHSDLKEILQLIDQMVMSGKDLQRFITEFAQFLRNILVCKVTGNTDEWFGLNEQELGKCRLAAQAVSTNLILNWIENISKLAAEMKYAGDVRIAIEVAFIRLMDITKEQEISKAPHFISEQNQPSGHRNMPVSSTTAMSLQTTVREEDTEAVSDRQQTTAEETRPVTDTQQEIAEEVTSVTNTQQEIAEEVTSVTNTQQEIAEEADPLRDTKKPKAGEQQLPKAEQLAEKEIWTALLDHLTKIHRIDLKMLLSPALVFYQNHQWQIKYKHDLNSHYQTIAANENKTVLEQALQEIMQDSSMRLSVSLEQDNMDNAENLNAVEADWIKEVRKMAKDLNIPIIMEEKHGKT